MNISRVIVVVAAVLGATATGCAAASAPEAKGQSHANEEIDTGGGGGADVDPNTLFMNVDQSAVFYNNANGGAISVAVCEANADPALIDQIKNLNGQPHLVLRMQDGTYDTRLSEMPLHEDNVYFCTGGQYGGSAYTFQLWQQDGGFLKNFDLSGAFVSGFAGESIGCEGGFQLSHGLDLDVKGFRVENGTVKQPEITLNLDGESTGQVQARCYMRATSGHKIVFAGVVPVEFELEVRLALQVSLSKASSFHATIGTSGGNLTTDDPSFTITPQLELGVTFYGVVGAYVGADFPLKITPHQPPCTPDVSLGVSLKAGAEAGLLGIPGLPITKALYVEVASPVLGPWQIATSQCN